MYARVTFAKIRPGTMDETVGLIPESLYWGLKQMAGFKGALLLTNREDQKVIGISLWDREEDIPHIGDDLREPSSSYGGEGPPPRRFFQASSEERRAMIPLDGPPVREIYYVTEWLEG